MSENKKLEQQQKDQRKWLDSIIQGAQNRNWFGSITIEIKRGMINLVRSEETLKPPK